MVYLEFSCENLVIWKLLLSDNTFKGVECADWERYRNSV